MFSPGVLLLAKDKTIHIVGIGGIGMSAIAKILHHKGYTVQGSDLSMSDNAYKLRELGVAVFSSHDACNINGVSIIVKSTAILDDNIELKAARANNLIIISRAEILTELLRWKHTIAISGTHGKTTVTSILGAMLDYVGYYPTIITGGIMNLYNDNVKLGSGDWNIVEADESDGTFVSLQKSICVVTNIEGDHLDYYKSYENLLCYFNRFVEQIPFYGSVIISVESAEVLNVNNSNVVTYAVSNYTADVYAINIRTENDATVFDIETSDKFDNAKIANITINAFGKHNVSNAVAAIGVALELSVPLDKIKSGLFNYSGVLRRFSYIGNFNGAKVIDDYAHHPTEITVTINTARHLCASDHKVVAIIEPHRFSRVQALFREYVEVMSCCEYVILLPIYSSGEKMINGQFTSMDILLESRKKIQNKYLELSYGKDDLRNKLSSMVGKGDVVLFMGAGDITNYAHALVE